MSRRHLGLMFPPGTCQTPNFYWRGGDLYKEPEHLQSDYMNAKNEHSKAKKELDEVKKEYEQVSEMFASKDKQAVALASSLGGDSKTTKENAELNKQIAQLTLDISEIEEKITEASNRAMPSYIAQLERERSSTYLSVERLSHDLEKMEKEINEINNEYYSLLTSDEWLEANKNYANYHIISRERSKLRQDIKNSFEEQNYAKEDKQVVIVNNDDSISSAKTRSTKEKTIISLKKNQTMRVRSSENEHLQIISELAGKRNELQNKIYNAQHNRYMAQTYKRIMISTKLDIISQLNKALADLGQEEVNVDELEKKYLPEGSLPATRQRPATTMGKATLKSPKSTRRPMSQTGRN